MARAYRGPYARQSTSETPYATALVWGTGVDPIHSYYGEGPPLRALGREGHIGSSPVANLSPRDREYQNPMDSSSIDVPQEQTWGAFSGDYSEDSWGQGANAPISQGDVSFTTVQFMDDRPGWDVPPESERLRGASKTMAPWGTPGLRVMGMVRNGSHRFRLNPRQELVGQGDGYQPISAEPSNSNPTETVSEGWINKGTSFTAYAEPADNSQVFVQTSMRQRFGTMDNRRAMMRGTDDERAHIPSRVMAMVEKVYSTGERSYDMFPFQAEEIRRPFRNRTAGVGPAEWMLANDINSLSAVQRTPPPDPSMGVPEVSSPDDYGFTGEDTMYFAN